jgi:signal peptidase I
MQERVNENIKTHKADNNKKDKLPSEKEKKSFTKSFLEQLELIVIFFAIMVLVFTFVCKTCKVVGESMRETLQNGETVLIWSLFYSPGYGDVVVIHDNEALNEPIVKRVIGLPGDKIRVEHTSDSMKTTITHADGSVTVLVSANEDYVRYIDEYGALGHYSEDETYVVNDGEVFVMGDNRLNSMDSRELGAYSSNQILGKVVFRIAPFNVMGAVN